MIGEGTTVLVPEFLPVSEVILELGFLRCGGEGILVADTVVSDGPTVTEEAAEVFDVGALGKSSPNTMKL